MTDELKADQSQLQTRAMTSLVFTISIALWILSFIKVQTQVPNINPLLMLIPLSITALGIWVLPLRFQIGSLLIFLAMFIRWIIVPLILLPSDLIVLWVLFTAIYWTNRTSRRVTLALSLATLGIIFLPFIFSNPERIEFLQFSLGLTLIGSVFSFGSLLRLWREHKIAEIKSAQRQAQVEIRDAEFAVAAERTRIAREMHDIVAHTLSVVIAQADGGRFAAPNNPAAAIRSLETISEMSRAALGDIRSIIGVLRDPDENHSPLRPQPVNEDLLELITQVQDSGHKISFSQLGIAQSLPVGLGNALYRICQEALTNSLKHSGPQAEISVILSWEENAVVLEVTDDGRGAAAANDGKGHGIVGMKERAAIFGGTVEAGPIPSGGYRVHAWVPIRTRSKELNND